MPRENERGCDDDGEEDFHVKFMSQTIINWMSLKLRSSRDARGGKY